VTTATSLPSAVVTRVCHTMVRRRDGSASFSPITVAPTGAGPTKLVLLSMVVVPCPRAGWSTVAAGPACREGHHGATVQYVGRVQSSGLTTISAFTPVSLAATNFNPGPWRKAAGDRSGVEACP